MADKVTNIIAGGTSYELKDKDAIRTFDFGTLSVTTTISTSEFLITLNATKLGECLTFLANDPNNFVKFTATLTSGSNPKVFLCQRTSNMTINGANYYVLTGTTAAGDDYSSVPFRFAIASSSATTSAYLTIGTTVSAAINALDATISGLSVSKTITALSETDGIISATASNISIAGSQITSGTLATARMPTGYMKEAYLEWGGKNLSASNSPLDAALINVLGGDRFAFLQASCITVEYSTDGGTTWLDYGLTDNQKTALFAPGIGNVTYLGKHTEIGSCTANDKLRITVDTYDTSANLTRIYSNIMKWCCYMATNGATGITWTCQGRTTQNCLAGNDDWGSIFTDVALNGWSGMNITNTAAFTIGSNAPTSATNMQFRQFRLTFSVATPNPNQRAPYIIYIMGFGGVGWSNPSNMSKFNSIYSYDATQNATFPAEVKATRFTGLGTNYFGTCSTAASTAAKVVTCSGFILVAGARISVQFTTGCNTTSTMSLNVNSTGAKACAVRGNNGTATVMQCHCTKNDILEFVYDGTYWVPQTPYALRNAAGDYTIGGRFTSANRSFGNYGLEYFLAAGSMTTGKPPLDSQILGMHWDNGTNYSAQLAVAHGSTSTTTDAGRLFTRAQYGTSDVWSDWLEIPRFSSAPTNGQVIVSDALNGDGRVKGVTLPYTCYGICSTDAGAYGKEVEVDPWFPALTEGLRVSVCFANGNTSTTPTLNVNSTGAKNMYWNGKYFGGTSSMSTNWDANTVVDFVYNGTAWDIVNRSNVNDVVGDLWFASTVLEDLDSSVTSPLTLTGKGGTPAVGDFILGYNGTLGRITYITDYSSLGPNYYGVRYDFYGGGISVPTGTPCARIRGSTTATIANGDALMIADSSASNNLAKTSITFDGTTTTQFLTRKGTWESGTLAAETGPISASVTGSGTTTFTGQYYKAGKQVTVQGYFQGSSLGLSMTNFLPYAPITNCDFPVLFLDSSSPQRFVNGIVHFSSGSTTLFPSGYYATTGTGVTEYQSGTWFSRLTGSKYFAFTYIAA